MVFIDGDEVNDPPHQGLGGMIPSGAVATSWNETEPLVDPEKLRRLHLFGIDLVSNMRDSLTGLFQRMDDTLLKDIINQAVSICELQLGLDIFAKTYSERQAYDRPEQNSFGYLKVDRSPILRVNKLSIRSSDNIDVWTVPNKWIHDGMFHQGQINIIPFAVAGTSGVTIPFSQPASVGLLPGLFAFPWVEGLWHVSYDSGFDAGKIPTVVNQLIGVVAAIEVLGMLATTYARQTSQSLGIDGLSQSTSGQGPQLFETRLKALEDKRKDLNLRIQRTLGAGFILSNV